MKGWELSKIKDLCDDENTFVQTGPFGSQLHASDYSEDGIPVIMPKDISKGKVSQKDIARVSENHVNRLKRHKIISGDIVYGRRGDIGRHALITRLEDGWLCGTGCLLIRLNKFKINPLFNHYYLSQQSIIDYVSNQAVGATMPNLNTEILKNIPLLLPPLPIQRKIAAVLSAYDDLIENNNRRIAILEKMAEELYREWFVRLRFPGHEKVKIVKGVPEGWEVNDSLSLLNVLGGGTPKTDISNYWDGEIPFFTPRDAGSGYFAETTDKNITQLGLEKCNSKLFPKNTIFITARGTVGKIVLSLRPMAMNQSCYALEAKSGKNIYYYFLAMRNAVDIIKGTSNSGVFDNIVTDSFKQFDLYQPNEQILSLFERNVRSFFKQLESRINSNSILKDSRDRLLTRLMSGKIDLEKLDIHFPQSMLDETAGEPVETSDTIPSQNRNADTRR